jgi:methyltransferase
MTSAIIVLGLVTFQRVGELLLARHNTARLLARGATETGARHYPLLVAMHFAWLSSLWIWGHGQPVDPVWLCGFVVLQCLRAWIILSLGMRWTTRIVVLPGAPLVATGPYRFMSHPNYAVVVCEIAVLPLALGLPLIALVFTALNAWILSIRIGAENRALTYVSRARAVE